MVAWGRLTADQRAFFKVLDGRKALAPQWEHTEGDPPLAWTAWRDVAPSFELWREMDFVACVELEFAPVAEPFLVTLDIGPYEVASVLASGTRARLAFAEALLGDSVLPHRVPLSDIVVRLPAETRAVRARQQGFCSDRPWPESFRLFGRVCERLAPLAWPHCGHELIVLAPADFGGLTLRHGEVSQDFARADLRVTPAGPAAVLAHVTTEDFPLYIYENTGVLPNFVAVDGAAPLAKFAVGIATAHFRGHINGLASGFYPGPASFAACANVWKREVLGLARLHLAGDLWAERRAGPRPAEPCPITDEPLGVVAVVCGQCRHAFDRGALQQALARRGACPMCRQETLPWSFLVLE